jgi:hypothetical protein
MNRVRTLIAKTTDAGGLAALLAEEATAFRLAGFAHWFCPGPMSGLATTRPQGD